MHHVDLFRCAGPWPLTADLGRSEDVAPPEPKDGEVLVDVFAAGLNFFE